MTSHPLLFNMKPTLEEVLEGALNPPEKCSTDCKFANNAPWRVFPVCYITNWVIPRHVLTGGERCNSSHFYDYLFNKMI